MKVFLEKIIVICFLLGIATPGFLFSQKNKFSIQEERTLDSLKLIIKNTKNHDSTLAKAYLELSELYVLSNADTAKYFCLRVKSIAENALKNASNTNIIISLKGSLAGAMNNLGYIYNQNGNLNEALTIYHQGLSIQESIKDIEGMATSYSNIASIYADQGIIAKSLEYYKKCLKIDEQIGDKSSIAASLVNIGRVYKEQKDLEKALEYYLKAKKLIEGIDDNRTLATCINNIGSIYRDKGDFKKAEEYFNQSLQLYQITNNKKGIGRTLNNLGVIYRGMGDEVKALTYFKESLKIKQETNEKHGMASSYLNIAQSMINQGILGYQQYAKQALRSAMEIGNPDDVSNAAKLLSEIYQEQHDGIKALEMYKLHIKMRDSLYNDNNTKKIVQSQMMYEFEKKEVLANAEQTKKDAVAKEEKEKQQIIIYAAVSGLILVSVFLMLIFNRFKTTQRQKVIIEKQKHLVEEKHKEITDSINYAERIQRSFLASEDFLNENLGNYFIFFKPKDVVSGDFYWASTLHNGHFMFATADSTGHGVPGAIMSLLNITSLEKAIEQSVDPAEILNLTRRTIIERLQKDGSKDGGKDGMDCSLVSLNSDKSKLVYAAANNPVWIIRNNTIIELPADKMPVGKHEKDSISFIQKEVDLQKGDMIYTLTDGFPDQFGGPNGKKFMYKKLKEVLLSISKLSTNDQHEHLKNIFTNWKGNIEQVDDVTIIGVRV